MRDDFAEGCIWADAAAQDVGRETGSGVAERLAAALGGIEDRIAPSRRMLFLHVLLHPAQLVLLSFAAVGLVAGSGWVVGSGLVMQLVLSGLALRSRTVDRLFKRSIRARRRAARDQLLAPWMTLLGDEHRLGLRRIDALIDDIRDSGETSQALRGALGRRLDLDRLLCTYVELALAHKRCTDLLSQRSRDVARMRTDGLRFSAAEAGSPAVRRLVVQRLIVAQRSIDRLDALEETRELAAQQLALIAELVELIQTCSVAADDIPHVDDEIRQLLNELDDNERIVDRMRHWEISVSEASAWPAGPRALGRA